jgi:predicted transcriptional regulator
MPGADAADGPPPFDDPFDDADVERRVYGTILQTRSPTGAREIAERADCDPKTARKYLEWFADLGIVTRHEGRPATYERNDAYFEWRRIDRLAAEHSVEELQRRVSELSETIRTYEEAYDAEAPDRVNALDVAASTDEKSIDEVYGDLGDWATARRERRQYERARQRRAAGTERARG